MTNFLQRRLDRIAPPVLPDAGAHTAVGPDPQVLADMRQYLDGKRVVVPGVSPSVQRATDAYLDGNG